MKAIIFDFDGVIHDTFELGYNLNKQIKSDFTREQFRSYFEGNLFQRRKKPSKKDRDKFKELEYEAFKTLKIKKEIKSELKKLNKDFDLYIISSNTINNLLKYFENNKLAGVFKEILAEEAHKSKVEKFKMLFDKYNFSAKDCIFITDTLGDILEANKVGVKTIAVNFGFHDEKRLKKGNPFKIISDFRDIRKIIRDLKD